MYVCKHYHGNEYPPVWSSGQRVRRAKPRWNGGLGSSLSCFLTDISNIRMARKARSVGFGDMKRAEGGDGRGPWEVTQYLGPSEVLLGDDTETYKRMVRQHLGNEKRRISHRLREIKRYKYGQTWVGPIPSEDELQWWDWEDRQLQIRRRNRSTTNPPPPNATDNREISTTDDDEDLPLLQRRKRLRRNNSSMPPPSPLMMMDDDVMMPPVPEYKSEDENLDVTTIKNEDDLHSIPETEMPEDA